MSRRSSGARLAVAAPLLFAAAVGCGDVTSDLITGPPRAGSGGLAGGGGASSGGATTGGASSGGTSGTAGTQECAVTADCAGLERNLCHPTRHVCVECTDEGHCDLDEDCSDALGECARPCTSPAECTGDDDLICDRAVGFCVECVGDGDCPSNQCSNWECSD